MPETNAVGINGATTVNVARMVGLPTSRTERGPGPSRWVVVVDVLDDDDRIVHQNPGSCRSPMSVLHQNQRDRRMSSAIPPAVA